MIESLPRREREVFEILCRLEEGTAGAVRNAMIGSPSDSAVRTLLSRLKAKGLVAHRTENQAYIYKPVQRPEAVATGALRRLVDTFFNGSPATAATALLGLASQLDPEELAALRRAIDDAGERQS
ncbi:BlaI/MecI/CopY family transcriptional regulator [uncultured Brevundimonas sp.]|uniref:BlaI/MecI/CopY family transcriptional regulator n=1 Tax=uncultured Brevundimonas sp. TaxID=213418 RepID=UPI0030EDD322|tara:strand:- start:579 stop:953 length:375 start_codon:yes stop_codon:yes gene_type:complete